MVLVVGATGLLGSEICEKLRSAGKHVRAMVRHTSSPEKVAALRAMGAETIVADLRDPASLARACEMVSSIVATASSTFSRQEGDSIESVDLAGYLNLIEAAAKARVSQFVYTSIPQSMNYDCPLLRAKRTVERQLASSGVPYTVLAANFFMEIWLSPALAFDYKNVRAKVYGTGERPVAWISYRDVAALAVVALDANSVRNRILTIGGPENLTPLEVVDVFTQVSGRPFEITHVLKAELQTQYDRASDPLGKSFAALMLEYAAGCPMDIRETLSLLPRQLTTVRNYALEVTGRA
ncbi:MAG TPA: NmrA family NAD(P)-binding protein [Bryobacteraceae bacterium]|jgi:NADH dehydrogenase